MIPGQVTRLLSADTTDYISDNNSESNMNPPELLNSMKLSGLPNHCLELKEEVQVILLRNLDQMMGLCNGTRLIIQKFGKKVLQAKIITGSHVGETVFIPRIVLSPTQTEWPFTFRRRQFPIKLAFAMTINKSQGQTLHNVGIYLKRPVFSHGQLYVAVSRCSNRSGLKVLLDNTSTHANCTQNIVYREVLNEVQSSIPITSR